MVVQHKLSYRDLSQGDTEPNDRKQRLRERFEVVKKLGQGTYGKVQLAVNKETKQEVAIKTIKKAKIENEQDLVRIRREIQIMSSIHHPHIIHIYEVFENQEKIVLIMQYASGGELYDYLGCRKKLEENEARRIFRQVASAILYCHKNHICHRDLKLENILLDDRGNAKIADFGLSNVFDERCKLKTFCGSPLYASPEIVKGMPYSGPEVDCWSLGVLLYTLVYGAMPFDGSNFKRLVKQISEGEYFEPQEKSGASGLIRRLLTVDIHRRATIRDICSDLWVNQGYDHSLLKVASDMANLTPVRLDLLRALSSSSTHAKDQPLKKQETIMTTQKAEDRSILRNGYFSKSHPLQVSETSAGRKRTDTTAEDFDLSKTCVSKCSRRQQVPSTMDNVKHFENEMNGSKTSYGHLPMEDTKKANALQALADDKTEANIALVVQDLLKDIVSKVEQHTNNSKMEPFSTSATKQAPELTGTKSLPQAETACQEYGITNNIMECKDTADTLSKVQKFLTESGRRSSLQQNKLTPRNETEKISQNSQAHRSPVVGMNIASNKSESGVYPEDINVVNTTRFAGKTTQGLKDIFSRRTSSIPNTTFDLQTRKAAVKMMERDVVIPIFNVCSNIPKRSVDLVKLPPKQSDPEETFQSTEAKPSEQDHKYTGSSIKPKNEEHLIENNNKDVTNPSNENVNTTSCNNRKDVLNFERIPQELTPAKDAVQNEPALVSVSSTEERLPETEVPKLPPRRRFLIKIPKQGQSNEQDKVTTPNRTSPPQEGGTCDKPDEALPQEFRTTQENVKQELGATKHDATKELLTEEKNKKASVCSEDTSLAISTTEADAVSGTKYQRKSRRDSSRRSLLFGAKVSANGESDSSKSEGENIHTHGRRNTEIATNAEAREFNESIAANTKSSETTEVLKDAQLLQDDKSPRDSTSFSGTDEKDVNSETQTPDETEARVKELTSMGNFTEREYYQSAEEYLNFISQVNKAQNEACGISCEFDDSYGTRNQRVAVEEKQSKPSMKPKQRSLSRTRAMSLEFESLALMPVRVVRPPMKPPGKVEIPKTFDPTQPVTSPKFEMREIIFIPTACVSENKEKIEKKIEKVKRAAIVIPPRRKSEAGAVSRKKKYTRSKTDFIPRGDGDDFAISSEEQSLTMDEIRRDYQVVFLRNGETSCSENMDGETACNEMWYSAISPDVESEECETRFEGFGDQSENADNFGGCYNDIDVTSGQQSHQHRHSVDTESGYWTPPEMTAPCDPSRQANMKPKDNRISRKSDTSEKIMLQRAAFKNSKLKMKLSDEGLDMCSLSSSLESGIYSWRQEDANGKRISPDNESSLKILSPLKFAEMVADGHYAPIARSFKKMSFPPNHSSTSELSENCYMAADENSGNTDPVSFGKTIRSLRSPKKSTVDSKLIKPSDSQSSYGSNDISDDVFESWADKEDSLISNEQSQMVNGTTKSSSTNKRDRKSRNWRHGEAWHSFSTDKESSDNDDDLDLMIDESHQALYGTEGLWQFLKSVNHNLGEQLNSATQKLFSKPACHRSKSQESKLPRDDDDAVSERRPVTRSLSREEKQKMGQTHLRHFVSEGKLTDADSIGCFEDSYARLNDTRYSSGYMASGSSLDDSGIAQRDYMSSVDSFHNHSDDISLYGTLRRDKYFQSSSALSSPSLSRRKSLQNPQGSGGPWLNVSDNNETIVGDEHREQNRKLSLYGTLRPTKHLSQQGRAQSQILLSTEDGYHLLYNERMKKDQYPETRYSSLGTLGSSVNKATSEVNVSVRETQLKDYEKLLLSDPSIANRSVSSAESGKTSSKTKKTVCDKGIRRVSFSSDIKAAKSDYHSTLRLNSLNKVREANEELSSTNTKRNPYEDEQDSGSLLEALKTYGYRGIMSQKLQSDPDRYEPRLNYRLPPEYYFSTGFNNTGWEDIDYVPLECTLAYQQPIYSTTDYSPLDYYHLKAFSTDAQMKRSVGEYCDLPNDDDLMLKNIYCYRLAESDMPSRRKSKHRSGGENRDAQSARTTKKKSSDSTVVGLSNERRNSGSEKKTAPDRESDETVPTAPTERSESRSSKQTENSIETLSEKIQALKSRCHRKSTDESKQKKQLDEPEISPSETQSVEKSVEAEKERLTTYCADSVEALSAQENESVSDRIWRKSFYPRFNDASTTRRKKSTALESEYLGGHNFLRGAGKFNIDEEGGVEEPWLRTSLKRRNSSNYTRSLPRHAIARASSLSSDETAEYVDRSSVYYKTGTRESETVRKSFVKTEKKPLSQTTQEQHSPPAACDKKISQDESVNNNKRETNIPTNPRSANYSEPPKESREDGTKTTETESCTQDVSKNNFTGRQELSSDTQKGINAVLETQCQVPEGDLTATSDIAAITTPLAKNTLPPSTNDSASSIIGEVKSSADENSGEQTANVVDIQNQSGSPDVSQA